MSDVTGIKTCRDCRYFCKLADGRCECTAPSEYRPPANSPYKDGRLYVTRARKSCSFGKRC